MGIIVEALILWLGTMIAVGIFLGIIDFFIEAKRIFFLIISPSTYKRKQKIEEVKYYPPTDDELIARGCAVIYGKNGYRMIYDPKLIQDESVFNDIGRLGTSKSFNDYY